MTWGLPGGKCDANEALLDAINRECQEELGSMPEYVKLLPIEKFTSDDGKFVYHTFFAGVADEFRPRLNDEHLGYAWIDSGVLPKPLHPGLWNTVNFDVVQNKISLIRDDFQMSQCVTNFR
jgi:8-oxo-dGTP pyrophosphatase MutT (NUDIX family)